MSEFPKNARRRRKSRPREERRGKNRSREEKRKERGEGGNERRREHTQRESGPHSNMYGPSCSAACTLPFGNREELPPRKLGTTRPIVSKNELLSPLCKYIQTGNISIFS